MVRMIDIEDYINNSFNNSLYEVLPPEFDPIQMLLIIPADPFAVSRKWFVYEDEGNEERYNEDW